MSQNETRLYATIAIWSALAVMGVAAMITGIQIDGSALVALFFVLIVGAAGGTHAVWNSGNAKQETVGEAEKTKRRSKVERMVEKLDEQELDELRARLMADNDGEAVSLDALMRERERQQR